MILSTLVFSFILLTIIIHGYILSSCFIKANNQAKRCLFSYPCGLLYYCFGYTLILILKQIHINYMLSLSLTITLSIVFFYKKRFFLKQINIYFVIYLLLALGLACLLFNLNYLAINADSATSLRMANTMLNLAQPNIFPIMQLGNYALFIPILQTLAIFTNRMYSTVFVTMLGISGVLYIYYLLNYITGYLTIKNVFFNCFLYSMPILFFLSTPLILFQLFILKGNLASGVFLLFFFGETYIYMTNKCSKNLYLAMFYLFSYTTARIESFVFQLFFMTILFYTYNDKDNKTKSIQLLFLYFNIAYLVFLLPHLRQTSLSTILSLHQGLVILLAHFALVAWMLSAKYSRSQYIQKYAQLLIILFLTIGIAFFCVSDYKHSMITIRHFLGNLFNPSTWGYSWSYMFIFIPIAACLNYKQLMLPLRFLLINFLIYPLIVLILGCIRNLPYFGYWSDSGNRMMTHIWFVAVFLSVILMCELYKRIQQKNEGK